MISKIEKAVKEALEIYKTISKIDPEAKKDLRDFIAKATR